MRWLPRLRLVFARRPWLYWALAGALTAFAWWQVSSLHDEARRARDAWGTTTAVWVALADASPGAPLAVERRDHPSGVVPRDAIDTIDPPAVAARHVSAGATIVAADVVGDDAVPASWVVFAVAIEGSATVEQGDAIAVFSGGQRLCDGTVTAPPGDRVEFGVPPECAGAVGNGVTVGDVVLARRA